MNGAVELHKACAKHGIKPIVGCEIYLVDDHTATTADRSDPTRPRVQRNHLTLLAADDTGYRNLVKLSSAGFLEGLQRGKPTVDLEQISRHAEGVIALTGCLASRFCQRLTEDRSEDARAHADELLGIFGSENVYFELQKNGLAAQEKCNEGIERIAREVGGRLVGTGDVHYLRREDYEHHTALLCVQTKSTIAAPKLTFDTNEFYLRDNAEMAEILRAVAGSARQHARDRRALLGAAGARQAADPELPDSRRSARARVSARARRGGHAHALRRPAHCAGDGADGDGARRDRSHGLQRLLPDRVGLRQVRQGERHRGGPRARLGGRLDRGVLPADHRRGPAALRAAVRALPQPRAGVDAGYRHRLLRARARARDALRDREVRARVGRADRHLRQDAAPRRHPRRGARARLGLRDRGPSGEADPRPDHGPLPLLRGMPEAGRTAAQGVRRGARGQAHHRNRAAAWRGSCATPRSTPPPS